MDLAHVLPGIAALGLLTAACSSAVPAGPVAVPAVSVAPGVPPPNTLYELDWSKTWNTSEERPLLAAEASPALVPGSGPFGHDAEVTFNATSSGGQPAVDIVARWNEPAGGVMTLQISRGWGAETLICEDIRDGGSYTAITILRGTVEGCGFTNEAGLFFLRWHAEGDSYLFQGSLNGQEALGYLNTWEPA